MGGVSGETIAMGCGGRDEAGVGVRGGMAFGATGDEGCCCCPPPFPLWLRVQPRGPTNGRGRPRPLPRSCWLSSPGEAATQSLPARRPWGGPAVTRGRAAPRTAGSCSAQHRCGPPGLPAAGAAPSRRCLVAERDAEPSSRPSSSSFSSSRWRHAPGLPLPPPPPRPARSRPEGAAARRGTLRAFLLFVLLSLFPDGGGPGPTAGPAVLPGGHRLPPAAAPRRPRGRRARRQPAQ